MQKKLIFTLIPVAIAISFLFWWFSDSQVLQRRSANVIDCIRMEEGTGRIERAFKAENLRDLIDSNLTVVYPKMESTFSHRYATNQAITLPKDRAKTALVYLSEIAEWITVQDESISVIKHNDNSAQVDVSFLLTAKLKGKSEQSSALSGTFEFSYTNNRWLLTAARFN
jgi:ABC-type sugar transport system ATPase subunit